MTHQHPEAQQYADATPELQRAAGFAPGQRVKYVPAHAYGDHHHEDCETGNVEKVTDAGVFVRFDYPVRRSWPQLCDPGTLVHVV